jgi:2-polyprenyl-6-methoxyphenol hydroxylase-like FAD-dependent oxidoreductase
LKKSAADKVKENQTLAVDFLIVGAGIGGAVLAKLLSRAGKRVVVLEREAVPPRIIRPEVLWPATVQFLETILPREQLHDTALLALRGLQFNYKNSVRVRVSSASFKKTGIQPWSSHGSMTRAMLLEDAGCEIERGVEVIGLLKEAGRVVGARVRPTAGGAEREISARWTVGDDGSHSIVRRECGIELQLHHLPMDPLLFALDWPEFLEPATAQIWLNPHRRRSGVYVMGVIPRPAGTAAGLIVVRPRLFDNPDELQRRLKQFLDSDRRLADVVGSRRFPEDLVRVRLGWGHAERYGTDGAVLIGDAAHAVTPAGGQGANMAIADARVLTDVIRLSESQLVQQYESRRRAANERSMAISRWATRLLSLPDFVTAPFLPAAAWLVSRFPGTATRGLRSISTAFLESSLR